MSEPGPKTFEEMIVEVRKADDFYTEKLNTVVDIAKKIADCPKEIQWMMFVDPARQAVTACVDMLVSVAVLRELAKDDRIEKSIRKSAEFNLRIVEGLVKGNSIEDSVREFEEQLKREERGY